MTLWTSNGIQGSGAAPPLPATHCAGPALVLGGGRCVWSDLVKACGLLMDLAFDNRKAFDLPCTVLAVNDIGAYFLPRLDHLVSHHEAQLDPVRRLRYPNNCHEGHVVTHCNLKRQFRPGKARWAPADFQWDFHQGAGGTSAMLAVMVALALGCSRVVLCGVPLDGDGHFFDPPWQTLRMFAGDTQRIEWDRAKQYWMANRVRAISGRTRDWLGAPTKEWWDGK